MQNKMFVFLNVCFLLFLNSNTSRIFTNVHREDVHASDDFKQAELFSAFFYEQFSLSSNYGININLSIDCLYLKLIT